jgi:hypothetical protein
MTTTTWAKLTPKQRKHLIQACSEGINPKNPMFDADTLAALKAAGLLHKTASRKGRVLWRPTDTGRGLVASRGMIPTFLHQRSEYGYTHSYHQALRGEPEAMEDAA